jgi:hypothetical protein
MKTKREVIQGNMYIWAKPKTEWQLERELEEVDGDMTRIDPFTLFIDSIENHWMDTYVRVAGPIPVSATVPEGVDLVTRAVETLRDKAIEIQKEADEKINAIEERIKSLALLTHQPSDEYSTVITGEEA